MNKADLISAVAAEAGLSKVDAKKAVEAFVSTVTKALQEGDKVSLIGFGHSLLLKEVQEQVSTHPQKQRLLFLLKK